MLKVIMHKGDSLRRDEPGERFDGGAAATWATRSHRVFTVHSVVAAAARVTFGAIVRAGACRRVISPSVKNSNKLDAHNPRNTAARNARIVGRAA